VAQGHCKVRMTQSSSRPGVIGHQSNGMPLQAPDLDSSDLMDYGSCVIVYQLIPLSVCSLPGPAVVVLQCHHRLEIQKCGNEYLSFWEIIISVF
jgi:hypothetical protein